MVRHHEHDRFGGRCPPVSQEQFAELLESTLVHSTADLIDFPAAAGFEAVASEAVH